MTSTAIEELRNTVARLRGPGGCPWDQEQTHQSLCDCLVEECAGLLDAIDRGDKAHMCEELGDLLLHVVLHAQIAQEAGDFDFDKVCQEVNEKLIRRHPHVFGDIDLESSEAVVAQWEAIKAKEKKNGPKGSTVFKHLPKQLSGLLYAQAIYKQLKKRDLLDLVGLPEPELQLTDENEAGEQLFLAVRACSDAGIDVESALRRYTRNVVDKVEKEVQQ